MSAPRVNVTRRFAHPRARVFAAWLDPERIGRWLFRTPGGVLKTCVCEPKVGGRFQIDEQRGDQLAQHFGQYLRIEPHERIVFSFTTDPNDEGVEVEVRFADDGECCVMVLQHDLPEKYAEFLERARAGWTLIADNLERDMDDALPTYVLEREFDAPRDLVWKSWTDAALLSRWYGPGCETIIHKLDVSPGGLWLLEMKMGARSMYQRVEYTEVAAPERLVWLHSMSDADWNIISAPHQPDWPRVLLTNVTFEESGGKTKVRLTWVPHQATDAEIACFRDALSSMDKGWGAGMKLLEAMLAELQG
jgi:uncharacterized protein YndB with AHSA1/START domain